MKATIDDVAREAGVSTATVSRVINNNYPVAKATREKVEKAIEKLHFTPNTMAKGLKLMKSHSIGVVIRSVRNPYFVQIVESVERYFKEKEYMTLLCHAKTPEEEKGYIQNLIDRNVDGVVIVDGTTENRTNGFFEKTSKKIPLVLINGLHAGIKCNFIISDQEAGTLDALNYLYDLGHKQIGFVTCKEGDIYDYSYIIKENAYKDFFVRKGLSLEEKDILSFTEDLDDDIRNKETAKKLLQERMTINGSAPTAYFVCNDVMAFAVIGAAKELGYRVPGDISIVGFDNSHYSTITSPLLTTVDILTDKLGLAAAKRLASIIEDNTKGYEKTTIYTQLVVRESCAKKE